MKAKKTDVVLCIGLLLTVLNDAVSLKLLTSPGALRLIPKYTKMKGENGEGQLLTYNLINPDFRVVLYDNIVANGNELNGISFEEEISYYRKSPPVGTVTGASKECGGLPGIKASPQKCTKKTPSNCESSRHCFYFMMRDEKECKWDPPSQEYCYKGMYIDFLKKWILGIQFMRLTVLFYDAEKENFLGVHIILLKEPTTEKDRQLMEKHKAFYSDGLTKTLPNITIGDRRKEVGHKHMDNDMSWMRNVLDRAKFYYVKKFDGPTQTQADWYYAGALMVKPEIVSKILKFRKLLGRLS